MTRILWCLVILCALLVSVGAQSSQPAAYTELEAARVENLALKRIIVQREVADFNAASAALKADLERTRSGWEWNPDTGAWTAKPAEVKK